MKKVIFTLLFYILLGSASTMTVDTCTVTNLPKLINNTYTLSSNDCYAKGNTCCYMTLNYSIPSQDANLPKYQFNETLCVLLKNNMTDSNSINNLTNNIFYQYSNEINYTWYPFLNLTNANYANYGANFNPPLFWNYLNGAPTYNGSPYYNGSLPLDYSSNPFGVFVNITCGNNVSTSKSTPLSFFKSFIIYFLFTIIYFF